MIPPGRTGRQRRGSLSGRSALPGRGRPPRRGGGLLRLPARRRVELAGRVVLITGGGRGIGAELARTLSRRGMQVTVADLDGASAEGVAREVGGAAVGLSLDVRDHAAFTAALDEVERRLGPLHVLVNNAGIMPLGPFESESPATTARQLAVNLHAVIHGTREAVARMRPRGTGHIVNVASSVGRTGLPGAATYSACKFGVVGLSEAVRGELRGAGVQVTVVLSGLVDTELAVGVPDSATVPRATVADVATAVAAALERPRFEVYVPSRVGVLVRLGALLPWPVRDVVADRLDVATVLARADPEARRAYETRAAEEARATYQASA